MQISQGIDKHGAAQGNATRLGGSTNTLLTGSLHRLQRTQNHKD